MPLTHAACVVLALVPLAAVAAGGAPDFSAMEPTYDIDVCILGGGPAGTAAAIAAARNGARTLLVEQYGTLGGTSTAAGVNVFMSFRCAGGVFREVLARLDKLGARRESTFDANLMAVALDELVTEAGVKVLLYTRAVACLTAPGRPWQGKPRTTITGLVIHNKSGLQRVQARVFVDCSGDADLAAWAGCPYQIGRPEDGATQPMTMMFRMGGCTYAGGSLMRWPGMADYWASYYWNPNPGEVTLNMTRIKGFSGLSGEDLTQATMAGRQAVIQAVTALRANVPGFENAYLLSLPAQVGVRETRRVTGATVLTGDQILQPHHTYAHRGDVIARNDYSVDIHDPSGTKAEIVRVPQPYEVPYRCLLPRGVDNLLVAGRPVSTDHVAHSSLRVQPACYSLGQAGGTAAALCVRHRTGPWEIGRPAAARGEPAILRELQSLLITQGADLGPVCARRLGLEPQWRAWQLRYRMEAYPAPAGFEDVPTGHPAYDAVMGLARMGVLRGVSPTRFDAAAPASLATVAAVVSRAIALLPTERPTPPPAPLPAPLSGQWWSSGLADCVARGVIAPERLTDLDATAGITAQELRPLLLAAFPAGGPLPELPTGLTTAQGAVTRAALAFWLWPRLRDWR